ncbi:replication restart helicase PriA [Nonlabens marinus]|uniref:Replication restart protein PriA n=1 Tax=Nonlabens marinus S1-08 TaxID=1454201 RepID=W8VRU2_9FLAO|nr:primosomal protein N' [Nonlabens marinus]BAO56484.1 helicase PriA essential for oriC/DnaA-independent DNA replication [Nonlabens marinus S1-08]
MAYFLDVILPLPLERYFSYSLSDADAQAIKSGMRVAVPFGKSKLYTGIAVGVRENIEVAYEIKDIEFVIDQEPILQEGQIRFWEWIASYYMCSVGQVMKAALPKSLLLESETIILRNEETTAVDDELTDSEFLIIEALENRKALKVEDVMGILDRKTVLPILKGLLEKDLVFIQEELYNTYKAKTEKYIQLSQEYADEEVLRELLDSLTRAPKQRQAIMTLFMMRAGNRLVKSKDLETRAGVSRAVIKSLVEKSILLETEQEVSRMLMDVESGNELYVLNDSQEKALAEIKTSFENDKTVLLHGVTSSGKTEIYVRLIQEMLEQGKQCLYLLPEIALTTQLISRLQYFFKHQVLVFHSKYSLNERQEVWSLVLEAKEPYVVIGARSALLLPFRNLGLVIVDEEHETSFKQFDPAPRYHARDTAIVLGKLKNSKVLLGSATPALETYYNTTIGKFDLVELKHRYGNVLMPEINMIDIKEKHRKKRMTHHFSDSLIDHMNHAFDQGDQVILFQNRRGFAPIMECNTCGHAPQCPNCDVSLTVHQHRYQMRCHYCGYHTIIPLACMACSSSDVDTKGFGTEQIEVEFKELFPSRKIARMDLDTTRGKYSYEKLIDQVESREVDCLVGTQMLTKGLDFRHVSLVGVLNADAMLNFPDFRAHERCFQLLTQVAGRAGRTEKRGLVLLQSYNPDHRILQQVSTYDYSTMFTEQLEDRYQFKYPPYQRLIRITFKHRDYNTTLQAGQWFVNALNQIEHGVEVLGPEFPPVSRIRNLYHVHALVKMGKKHHPETIKGFISKVRRSFESIKQFRAVRCNIDVDCY